MTEERYHHLMWTDPDGELTQSEIEMGWHFCNEFDGLLVGPGMGELNVCHCWPSSHPVYETAPPENPNPVFPEIIDSEDGPKIPF